jgi:hypothetical protein
MTDRTPGLLAKVVSPDSFARENIATVKFPFAAA